MQMTGPEFIDRLSSAALLHHPGAVWDYGFGLDVLGLVVEQVTGQTLGQYLHDNVCQPLGMVDSHFVIPVDKVVALCQSDADRSRRPAARRRCVR